RRLCSRAGRRRGALEAPKLASGADGRRWPQDGGAPTGDFRFARPLVAKSCIVPRMVARMAFRRPTIVIFLIVLGAIAAPAASATPRFHVECPFHHFNKDDPIVYPGQRGASHMHTFF